MKNESTEVQTLGAVDERMTLELYRCTHARTLAVHALIR